MTMAPPAPTPPAPPAPPPPRPRAKRVRVRALTPVPPTGPKAPTSMRGLPVPVSEPHAVRSVRMGGGSPPPTQGALALAGSAADWPSAETYLGPPRPSGRDLPDPAETCAALALAVVEVLSGVRPTSQLVRWVTADVYTSLQQRAGLVTRFRRGADVPARRAVVRRVRTCEPAEGIVEACAVVILGDRARAVALRLVGLDGRWRATVVEVG